MSNLHPRKITNIIVGSLLGLGLVGIGVAAYQQVSADNVVPGYATARLHFNVTVPLPQKIKIKAAFTPPSGKNFYFKEREFDIKAEGLNTVDWYIRKIPGGTYSLTLDSPQGVLQSSPSKVTLNSDKVADAGKFSLNLGSPLPKATETATVEPTSNPDESASATPASSATPGAASGDQIPFPPVPELPS